MGGAGHSARRTGVDLTAAGRTPGWETLPALSREARPNVVRGALRLRELLCRPRLPAEW